MSNKTRCQHSHLLPCVIKHADDTFEEYFECPDCRTKFLANDPNQRRQRLLDEFAMAALVHPYSQGDGADSNHLKAVGWAYDLAEAMLKEREKRMAK
jgi:hypothetical protein